MDDTAAPPGVGDERASEPLGERLARARRERGWSQALVAEKVTAQGHPMTKRRVSYVENLIERPVRSNVAAHVVALERLYGLDTPTDGAPAPEVVERIVRDYAPTRLLLSVLGERVPDRHDATPGSASEHGELRIFDPNLEAERDNSGDSNG